MGFTIFPHVFSGPYFFKISASLSVFSKEQCMVLHITQVELDPWVVQFFAHNFLLELVTADDTDLLHALRKHILKECMAE